MEQPQNSVMRTPRTSDAAPRKSTNKSWRQSYRGYLSAASRLGQTPALTTRRLNTSRRAVKSHNITGKVNPEHLAVLVKTEWQLSYVTPLYQFRHTQLKSYSRQLSAFIAAERQPGLAVDVEGLHCSFKVSFSVVEGMTETDDAEMVLIQIHTRQDEQKLVWRGWLTCISGNPEYLRSLPKDFTCLPLFGSSGTEALTSLVKSWFRQTFDCCFGHLEINHINLQWLAALWTNCHTESNIQDVKMIWTLPVEPPLQVTYTVDPQDAWELWNSVRLEKTKGEDGADSIDIEEVGRFMQGLKNHFYRHFKLDLSAGSLKQVSTALGSAKFSGRIKLSNSRYIITTLTLLTECALLKMPI